MIIVASAPFCKPCWLETPDPPYVPTGHLVYGQKLREQKICLRQEWTTAIGNSQPAFIY